ncbi:MAG: Rne/Rng family ribonuclease [Bacteroidia bacterium]|nr:Rne/Rng family ribonuclease [Bacteroidia bacterium]
MQIAILENKKLVELHYEKKNNLFSVGDIFLGKVKRILPGLHAVFIDIGYPKDAFLHYTDLGPQIRTQLKYIKAVMASKSNIVPLHKFAPLPDIDKHGKISDVLKVGSVVLVQIMKEAISSKGPRLSSQISIPGQYLILLPFSSEVSVSRKFKSLEEKRRIKQLVESIRPPGMGLIVRTAAEGVEFSRIQDELEILLLKWENIVSSLVGATAPMKVMSEVDRTSGILRDMLSIGFDAIYTDDINVYNDILDYLEKNQPEKKKILHYKKTKGNLFEIYGIEKQIKSAFGKIVNLSNGSYLVVEHTEALHVFDVNSGSQRMNEGSPEENALRINLEAASEIARQLRLRDMGGIIVIDFIDQKEYENRKKIYQFLKEEMSRDRAKHTILPMSRFGLVQITRQRVRPEVNIITEENCPSCGGTGKIRPAILLADEIENNIDYLLRKSKIKRLKLIVNPFVAAFFKRGIISRQLKWFFRYGKWIKIEANTAIPFTKVRYFDEKDDEIKLD